MIIKQLNTYLNINKLLNILKNININTIKLTKNNILNKENEINNNETNENNENNENNKKIYKTIDSMIIHHKDKIQFFNYEKYKTKIYNNANCVNLISNEDFYINLSSTNYINKIDNNFKINTYTTPFIINNVIVKTRHVLLENDIKNHYMILNKNNTYFLNNYNYINLLDLSLLYDNNYTICYFTNNKGKILIINLKNDHRLKKIILLIQKYGNIENLLKKYMVFINHKI